MKSPKWVLALVCATTVLSGCASPSLSGDVYNRNEARQAQQVRFGVVEAVRPVIIEGRTEGPAGTLGGAAIGGIAGSQIGGGSGRSIATVVGAIAGSIAGQQIEKNATRKQGQEITVRLERGGLISIVQEAENGQMFRPGDQVRVLQHGGTSRVTY